MQRSAAVYDRSASELPADIFCAPSFSDLSVASCSLSRVATVPEVVRADLALLADTHLHTATADTILYTCLQTPLHLDIPYVAASPASHSNTLASIERFDTPRASNYGPVSEAGRAVVAARKHSMRQEHLAAIANLNTFAQKRASKSPKSFLSEFKVWPVAQTSIFSQAFSGA